MQAYTNELKKIMCKAVCDEHKSTIAIAELYHVPLKTFEKWITAYNKDPKVFNSKGATEFKITKKFEKNYSYLSKDELRNELMKRDVEIARLKKGYAVKGVGTKKEYVTFCKKNMK